MTPEWRDLMLITSMIAKKVGGYHQHTMAELLSVALESDLSRSTGTVFISHSFSALVKYNTKFIFIYLEVQLLQRNSIKMHQGSCDWKACYMWQATNLMKKKPKSSMKTLISCREQSNLYDTVLVIWQETFVNAWRKDWRHKVYCSKRFLFLLRFYGRPAYDFDWLSKKIMLSFCLRMWTFQFQYEKFSYFVMS